MALFRCKMCGGTLEINPDSSIAVCEYCGTKQTVPKADDEKKLNLFNRANRLRFANEFDKAAGVYESIVTEFPEEAEAYWGLVLCKYGIEYVDDPRTLAKIPTCHRTAYDSIFKDANFNLALEYADTMQTQLYRDEAKEIDRLQKAILEIAAKQEPFDVFICYKETGETGTRTEDSVIANDIYDALTAKGFKVFYSRITLESKLGQEYEPLIFSALNSAKVMLAIGTKYEYYNAVWVKNEWSRYLQMMKEDKAKTLIPCYKGIDAYDMPEEFTHLQAQDMGKIGAVQELVRGIERLISTEEKVSVASNIKDIIDVTLERTKNLIAAGDNDAAKLSIDVVRGYDDKNAMAFVYKTMIDLGVKDIKQLSAQKTPLENNENFRIAVENADSELKKQLEEYNTATLYNYAVEQANKNTQSSISTAIDTLERIPEYKDSVSKIKDYQGKLDAVKKANKKKNNAIKVVAVVIACIMAVLMFVVFPNMNKIEAQKIVEQNQWDWAEVNGRIELGRYKQTNDSDSDPISWRVLAKNGTRYLLMSEYILDFEPYDNNVSIVDLTWESSDIRKSLNDDFLNKAFSGAEQLLITETVLSDIGTTDKVFLLSFEEVKEYLNDSAKNVAVSEYMRGHTGTSNSYTAYWWLRDMSKVGPRYMNGKTAISNTDPTDKAIGIRPVIWVDLSLVK